MEKIPPRLSVLEAAVALALEQGQIQRDDARRNSFEWEELVARRMVFYAYLRAYNIDTVLVDKKVMSILPECYGPINPVPPACCQELPAGEIVSLPTADLSAPAVSSEAA